MSAYPHRTNADPQLTASLRLVSHFLQHPVPVEQLPDYLQRAVTGRTHPTDEERQAVEDAYGAAAQAVPLPTPVSLDDCAYLQKCIPLTPDEQHVADPTRLVRAFFHALHTTGCRQYTELRMIRSGGARQFFSNDVDDLLNTIDLVRDSANVYVGVATRTNTGGGTKDDCGAVYAIGPILISRTIRAAKAEARSISLHFRSRQVSSCTAAAVSTSIGC